MRVERPGLESTPLTNHRRVGLKGVFAVVATVSVLFTRTQGFATPSPADSLALLTASAVRIAAAHSAALRSLIPRVGSDDGSRPAALAVVKHAPPQESSLNQSDT